MSRLFTSLMCFCLLASVMNSCKSGLTYKVANEHGLIGQAIEALESDYKSTKKLAKKKEIAAKLGELYFKVNNYTKADTYLKMATQEDDDYKVEDPTLFYKHAQTLKAREKYDDALEKLKRYQSAVPGDPKVAKEIELCEQAMEWQKSPVETRYRITEAKNLNNGRYQDFAPVIIDDGIVFTSNRSGEKEKAGNATGDETSEWRIGQARPDIFIARKQKGKKKNLLSRPVLFESEGLINTIASEGVVAFAPKAKEMIYTSCNRPYEQAGLKRSDSNCVLMTSTRKGKTWSEPSRLPICIDSTKFVHYGQPSLSEDGTKLYFASNMPGGHGGYDIWVSTFVKRSNTWSDPINLGPTVNTDKDEMYPHIYDGALYFSSNGHPGVGGLDLFVTFGRGNDWKTPENLLPPMNTGADDFSIFFERDKKKTRRSGDYGYLASNRGNSSGTDNLYSFTMVPLNFTVAGYVTDSKTDEVIANARVTLMNQDDTTKVFVTTNELGYYFMKLDNQTNYALRPFKEKFQNPYEDPAVSTFGYKVSKDFARDMKLDPMQVEFELDILYDLDQDSIRTDAAVLLDSFANTLKEHWYTQMELSSHTDCRGNRKYNQDLAQRRAESAVNYLISKGIERERLIAKGYGEEKLKNDCGCEDGRGRGQTADCTDDMHQANRRTEIRILSFDYVPKVKVEDDFKEYVDPELLEEEEEGEGEEGSEEEEEEGGGLKN